MKMKDQTVRVYDFTTERIAVIPADELAPGMIKVRSPELGEVWVKADELQARSEPRHRFDDSIIPLIEEIKAALDEVYPQSMESWLDGFSKDYNPEREIALWFHIGEKYRAATQNKNLTQGAKNEYFSIFLSCCNSGQRDALQTLKLEVLSREEAEQAVRFFFGPSSTEADL